MRDVDLDVYRRITFTTFSRRDLQWLEDIIARCEHCPLSADEAANYVMGAALAELGIATVFTPDHGDIADIVATIIELAG